MASEILPQATLAVTQADIDFLSLLSKENGIFSSYQLWEPLMVSPLTAACLVLSTLLCGISLVSVEFPLQTSL